MVESRVEMCINFWALEKQRQLKVVGVVLRRGVRGPGSQIVMEEWMLWSGRRGSGALTPRMGTAGGPYMPQTWPRFGRGQEVVAQTGHGDGGAQGPTLKRV